MKGGVGSSRGRNLAGLSLSVQIIDVSINAEKEYRIDQFKGKIMTSIWTQQVKGVCGEIRWRRSVAIGDMRLRLGFWAPGDRDLGFISM